VITDRVETISNPYGIFMQTLSVHSLVMRKVGEFAVALRVIQYVDIVFLTFSASRSSACCATIFFSRPVSSST